MDLFGKMKRHWPFWPALCGALLVMTGPAMGIPPLDKIQKENLAAAEILIGWVKGIRLAPSEFLKSCPAGTEPKIFTLHVDHAVKSQSRVQTGDQVEVVFTPEEGGTRRIGLIPVCVSVGDWVIVYANSVERDKYRVLRPVLAGFSVVRLGSQTREKESVRSPEEVSEEKK